MWEAKSYDKLSESSQSGYGGGEYHEVEANLW